MELDGKVALVTGAGSGIGRATAHALAQAGARLMIVDIHRESLDDTRGELLRHSREIAASVVDIADPEAVSRVVAETVDRVGRLDLAHNNAGVRGPIEPLASYPLDAARRLFDVNV